MKQNPSSSNQQSSNVVSTRSNTTDSTISTGSATPIDRPDTTLRGSLPYDQISARAYQLWEKGGFAAGQDLDHWYEAERQLENETNERTTEANDLDKPLSATSKFSPNAAPPGSASPNSGAGLPHAPVTKPTATNRETARPPAASR